MYKKMSAALEPSLVKTYFDALSKIQSVRDKEHDCFFPLVFFIVFWYSCESGIL